MHHKKLTFDLSIRMFLLEVRLFDELTSALDHGVVFARDVSSCVVFMDKGGIAESGPDNQIINNPQNERTEEFLNRYLTEN